MRFTQTLPLLCAAALAACGGTGMTPASGAGNTNASAVHASAQTTSRIRGDASTSCYGSAVQTEWVFSGPCRMTALRDSGATFPLATYGGVTLHVSVPGSNARRGSFAVVEELNPSRLASYEGITFPPTPQVPGPPPGHLSASVMYVELVNGYSGLRLSDNASLNFDFYDTDMFSFWAGSTTCWPSLLVHLPAGGYGWQRLATQTVLQSNRWTTSIGTRYLAGLFGGSLPQGPTYFNVSCGFSM